MTFTPTTEDFLSLASDMEEQEAVFTLADREDYLAALDDALGSTPRPRPTPWSAAYSEGYDEGRRLHLEACL